MSDEDIEKIVINSRMLWRDLDGNTYAVSHDGKVRQIPTRECNGPDSEIDNWEAAK
jgi:hypothetical protein